MTAQEDVFHHVHDLLAIPLFLLFIVAAVIRLPRVCQLLRLQRQRAVTTDALLLNVDEVLSGLPPPPKSGVLCLRAFHLFCCASLVGIYVALLSVPPSDSSLVQVGQVAGVVRRSRASL